MIEEKIAGWPLDRRLRKGDDVCVEHVEPSHAGGKWPSCEKREIPLSLTFWDETELDSVGSGMDPFLTIPAYPIERLPMT